MRLRIFLLLIFGFFLLAFSNAEASITWTGDNFIYSAEDTGGIYFPGMYALSNTQSMSTADGDSENSSVATATESYSGLSMASGAWGGSSQNSSADSGGATVHAYAANNLALDNQTGVLGAGQNVISYIDRSFTVSSTGQYTLTASGAGSLYSNITSGSGYVSPVQLRGEVQLYQTDSSNNTRALLSSEAFSLSSLANSPQTVALQLVSGDSYQLVVALSGVTSLGGQNAPAGIVTSYTNYSQLGFLGNLDGTFGAGTSSNPVTLTASLSPGSIISTIAGNGTAGYSGDGGPAASAELNSPSGVAVDFSGNIYIADYKNNRIRRVDASGVISTVAGKGTAGYSGDGGPASSAELSTPSGVAVDTSGNIYIADSSNNCVRKVDASGVISTVAGNGTAGYSGDGGPAVSAELSSPSGVAVDTSGNIYIADDKNNCIRKVDASGVISTVAGNGTGGYSGDGGPATSAELSTPSGVAVDASSNIYIADSSNNCIRKVDASGVISTVAGKGTGGYSGDGGPASSAELSSPFGVAVDASGNIYIADDKNNRIRKVDASGVISTVAGNGTGGYSGDGGPATSAQLNSPSGLAVDSSGNIYIADTTNYRVREVYAIINGACGSSNGRTFASAPTSGLCSSGTASSVTGTGPWYWICAGHYGGSNAGCSANPPAVNGACGSSNGGSFTSAPTSGLCSSGAASSVTGTGPWSWTCAGQNGGRNASCSANHLVSGACGSSNGGTFSSAPTSGLCSSGTASSVTGTGPWSWTCAGQNGGTDASCSANPPVVNGACGSSDGGTFSSAPTSDLCSSGTASSVTGTGPWSWTCAGQNGGTDASCSADVSTTGGLWQTATDLGGDWKWLKWFGYFNTDSSPWIYHLTLGWLYPFGTSTDSIWFYDPAMGSFWWTSATVFPYVYRASDGHWLYYSVPAQGQSSTPRRFYDLNAGKWESD